MIKDYKLLPIFLNLKEKPLLLIGAGKVAEQKLETLLPTGARIKIVAEKVSESVGKLLETKKIASLDIRPFAESDLEGQYLVIAATNDSALNHSIAALARQKGLLINSVDDPPNCDFYMGAVVDRGAVRIAISTQGSLPGLSGLLRKLLEELLPEEHDALWNELMEKRSNLRKVVGTMEERMDILREAIKMVEARYFEFEKIKSKN